MAKKICPLCGKKLNENDEICPSCGYYFSNYDVNIDLNGRPYSEYQENQHSEHYSKYNENNNLNTSSTTNTTIDTNDNEDYILRDDIFQNNQKNNKNSRIINTSEDLQNAVKTILNYGQSGMVFLNIFFIIWTVMAVFIFINSVKFIHISFMAIFPLFFVFIGIFIIIKANKSNANRKFVYNLISNNNYDAFMEKINQESSKTTLIDGRLLYAGCLVAYYNYNNKELSKKYLEIALSKAPIIIFNTRKYFNEIINDFNMADDVSRIINTYYMHR